MSLRIPNPLLLVPVLCLLLSMLVDVQYRTSYRPIDILQISLSLLNAARVHSTLQPCSSNQCDTARLELKLTRFQTRLNASYTDYRRLRRRTKQRLHNTRSVADSSLVHSSVHIPPHFFTPLTIVKNNHLVPLTFFVTTAHICTTMMSFDHDKFLPLFVKLSTSLYRTNISSQYNSTHYNDNAQHGAWYNSTKPTTLPLPGESQRTHLSTINAHNTRPIDSAHFAQPMSQDTTYHSPTLVHLRNNSPASSTCIVSYIGRQYARTVPNVYIVGSSKCHTRHLATSWLLTETLS
jgi:hypothetical protein